MPPDPQETIIKYWPGATARRAHQGHVRVRYAWGPIRTGKSVWLCWRFYYLAVRAAKLGISLRGVILRDTYRNLKDTTLATWDQWFGPLCETIESIPRTSRLHLPDTKITADLMFRHGQTAAEASNFLSLGVGFIGLEEVAPAFTVSGIVSPGIAEEVFDMALGRLEQTGIAEPELCMTSNPPPIHHWASKRLIDVDPAKLAAQNWQHYWFPPEENQANIRPGFYEELTRFWPEDMIKRFVKGERIAMYPGLPVYQKDFSERIHVVDSLKPISGLPLILCVDSSGLTPAALFTQVDHKGRWLWLRELQGGFVDGKLTEQIGPVRFADECKAVAAEYFPGYTFKTGWGDPFALTAKASTGHLKSDEKSWQEIFKANGFDLQPGVRSITDRIEGVRERLNKMIEGTPGVQINRQGCPLAIEALSGGYRWGLDVNASRVMGTEPQENQFTHVMDAAGHAARKIFPLVRAYAPKEYTPPRLPPSPMAS